MGSSESRSQGASQDFGSTPIVPKAADAGCETGGLLKQEAGKDASQQQCRSFPLPKGWRVVCRLPASDPRSRWGARPRPETSDSRDKATSEGASFEADVVAPELRKPLRVPLQLLPQWTEPRVGEDFLGRFEVRQALPQRSGTVGRLFFEVADKARGGERRCLRVLDLERDTDVRSFAERLQLESLDADGTLFLKLHDLSVALPGKVAAVEDAVACTLWAELAGVPAGSELVARIGAVANAALMGLRSLHANGWAHCNVTPHSVVQTIDGRWKLAGLEYARRARELAGGSAVRCGTAVSPEALLGLKVTEKVDVWQLGCTLAESILQARLEEREEEGDAADPLAESARLCRMVDFAGPLPENLVARHPRRELLFTPEGQVLRPVTPDVSGAQDVEAIEPAFSSPAAGDDSRERPPRLWLLAEKLGGAEGAADILEFLGRLLEPDPEHRPSAGEALAHHFLRFAHTKGNAGDKKVGFDQVGEIEGNKVDRKVTDYVKGVMQFSDDENDDEEEDDVKPKSAKIKLDNDVTGNTTSKIQRKGTGFVHVGELPASDDEEDEDDKPKGVKIQDSHGDNESKLQRKGTGFVNLEELPPSSDEEEEDTKAKGVTIQDGGGGGQGKLARKGTGFVNVGELPPSSDEEEEEEETSKAKGVKIQDDTQETSSKLQRKGTGFVNVGELPPSSDEEEEEEPKSKGVQIQDNGGGGQGKLARKGTGFVNVGELPPSSDEEEEEEPKARGVKIEDSGGGGQGKLARKGTGFVNVGELPPSSDEEEEEEPKAKGVKIQDSGGGGQGKLARKGTGFVNVGELPPSSDEEEEEVPKAKGVQIQESGDGEEEGSNKLTRKGTGFVNVGELPESSDEEDDAPKRGHAQIQDSHGDNESKLQRKGTGFVNIGELPPSSDEEEDEEPRAKGVQIQDNGGGGQGKLARKGTGFVNVGELPPSSDEEEEEEDEPKTKGVQIQDNGGGGQGKLARKGTGFVNVGELPPSSDEEEEDDDPKPKSKIQIQDSHGDNESKLQRKGTGFVNIGELPPSSDEEEDEDPKPKGRVKVDDEHGDNENKLARKGTGFVNLSELPPSSDEDE